MAAAAVERGVATRGGGSARRPPAAGEDTASLVDTVVQRVMERLRQERLRFELMTAQEKLEKERALRRAAEAQLALLKERAASGTTLAM